MVDKPAYSTHDYSSSTRPVPVGNGLFIGAKKIVVIAGPCSVESYEQVLSVAVAAKKYGIPILRGGAYKPRTSPHSFQGLGLEGLKILRAVADETGMLVVSEALGVEHVEAVSQYADIIQVGSRNMQHFPLLWAVGETNKPILLKRGFMSTVDEWLLAAEHVVSRGNEKIILCERGIRTFETATRNTLDAVSIALVKQISSFPVIGDPSHAAGRNDLVIAASRIALAAGADGLMVEVHPEPEKALSDGEQALSIQQIPELIQMAKKMGNALGRSY